MLHGFNLKLDNNDFNNQPITVSDDSRYVRDSLNHLVEKDGVIDGDRLESEWFPLLSSKKVFISHSHSDELIAKRFASFLKEKFSLESFIDSTVWGYSDQLIKKINDQYSRIEGENLYSYEKCNVTASHVYTLLSNALNLMIDHCECLIFLNTDNSVDNHSLSSKIRAGVSTYSPWLMSELRTSSVIRNRPMIKRTEMALDSLTFNESLRKSAGLESSSVKVSYSLPIEHLHKLNAEIISKWVGFNRNSYKGYDALTELYNLAAGTNYNLGSEESKSLVW
ncbi:hypothetical protein [Bacterioplanoides sp.]|uniref:hypothetical protein n=1 Tax=Bacterioplanoides sp. TaxID=2066072 RepID=UPI003B5CBE51